MPKQPDTDQYQPVTTVEYPNANRLLASMLVELEGLFNRYQVSSFLLVTALPVESPETNPDDDTEYVAMPVLMRANAESRSMLLNALGAYMDERMEQWTAEAEALDAEAAANPPVSASFGPNKPAQA